MKRAHFIRDRHLGAELLRLIVSARHQGDAGYPSRKAEIIFDPSRGTGLTAKGAAIEHEDGQSFRRGIDCGGKTGGDGSPHSKPIEVRPVGWADPNNTTRQP